MELMATTSDTRARVPPAGGPPALSHASKDAEEGRIAASHSRDKTTIGMRAVGGMSCMWCERRTRRVSAVPMAVGDDGDAQQTCPRSDPR